MTSARASSAVSSSALAFPSPSAPARDWSSAVKAACPSGVRRTGPSLVIRAAGDRSLGGSIVFTGEGLGHAVKLAHRARPRTTAADPHLRARAIDDARLAGLLVHPVMSSRTPPTEPTPPALPTRNYALPIVALAASFLGLFFPPLFVVGAVLGWISFRRTKREPDLRGRGLAVAAMAAPVVLLPIVVVVAIIAVPNFAKRRARAHQEECKAQLVAIHEAQRQLFAREQRYTDSFAELGFTPPADGRYSYFLGSSVLEAKVPGAAAYRAALTDLPLQPGVQGQCPQCEVTAACVGNADQDATLDVWVISSGALRSLKNRPVEPGTPDNRVDDSAH